MIRLKICNERDMGCAHCYAIHPDTYIGFRGERVATWLMIPKVTINFSPGRSPTAGVD